MKATHWLAGALFVACLSASANGQTYSEGFESYALGTSIVGQGGWREFNGVAGTVSTIEGAFASSGSQSLRTDTGSNTIREWTNFQGGTGQWLVTTWSYIPSTTTEELWFKQMSFYRDNGPYFWTAQIGFNTGQPGSGRIYGGSTAPGTFPVIFDRWVEIELAIDLDADTIEVFYDGMSLGPAYPYTSGYAGVGTGPKWISAAEFQHTSTTPGEVAYWDDVRVQKNFPPPIFFCTAKTALVCGVPAISSSGAPQRQRSVGLRGHCGAGALVQVRPPALQHAVADSRAALPGRLPVPECCGAEAGRLYELPGHAGCGKL